MCINCQAYDSVKVLIKFTRTLHDVYLKKLLIDLLVRHQKLPVFQC